MDSAAWALAFGAGERAGVELRPLISLEDAGEIVRVMIATWGNHQLLPREMIHALNHSGNVSWGAFDAERLIGFDVKEIRYYESDTKFLHRILGNRKGRGAAIL